MSPCTPLEPVERIRHTQDSQGQTRVLILGMKSLESSKLLPIRSESLAPVPDVEVLGEEGRGSEDAFTRVGAKCLLGVD